MPKREKFGKFVLLDEVETSGLGTEYRAAKLGPNGLEKIVTVLRVRPDLSAKAETVKSLMDQVKFAAQLQNPNIVKLYGIGKVEASFYISHEFIEGKSLHAVFARGRQDGFPFSADHTLLIASKVCSALEYAHGRKTEGGARYFHGLVTPANVIVSYEGEVRTRGFGYWPARLREAGGLNSDEFLYLAPEQAAGGVGDTRSDIFAVGALLFQMLTGEAFFHGGREIDFAKRLADAKLLNPTSDDDALPKPIREILRKSLTEDPAARYAEVPELRKGVDTLLFSGDFSPTTFNLAFFMHSLFREDIDRESKVVKEEKEASYLEFITEDVKSAPRTSPGMPAPSEAEMVAAVAAGTAAAGATTILTPPPLPAPPAAPAPAAATVPPTSRGSSDLRAALIPPSAATGHGTSAAGHGSPASPGATAQVATAHGSTSMPAGGGAHAPAHHAPHPEGASARETAAGPTFHKQAAPRGAQAMVWGGIAAAVLTAAGAAAFFLKGHSAPPPAPATPPPTTMNAEMVALAQRARGLEEQIKALVAEQAAAATEAQEDARKKVEALAAARGQVADPAAVARAQEDARRKSEAEQARKADAERRRLEEEQRQAEAQLAEEQRRAEEARLAEAAAAAAAPAPTTLAAAPPAPPPTPPPPATRPGALVDVNEPGVIGPVALNKPSLAYPPIALRQRIEGKVELSVLVDERGGVSDAKVVSAAGGKSGLNEAARDYVRRWKFRPATKEGVPVKTWTPVSVVFMLPR